TINRPNRLKAQFSEERIADLRSDKALHEPMLWAWQSFGERVYTELPTLEKEILAWCEEQGLNLNAKKRKALVSDALWQKQQDLLNVAEFLLKGMGSEESADFNVFSDQVDQLLKADKIKLSASEKKSILAAVSWYDADAAKVVQKTLKLSKAKLAPLCERLGCSEDELSDYGYYPGKKKGTFLVYEAASALRDTENIPLKEEVHGYFLREVKPHVAEAWMDLEKTKIGYEISFNKYFYQHKPLRDLDEVAGEILALEQESEGLIMDILGV
ncbi:MAG: SAM-dependent DNA methyltransferase, partial [Candidatus Electrothrix sp. AR1]|nr:SAM-dependent DNA methyltransferase [Candidatus Electrothrix sp. AR1]